MFNFPDAAAVKKVVHSLPRVGVGTNFGLPQTRLDTQLHTDMYSHSFMRHSNICQVILMIPYRLVYSSYIITLAFEC